MKKLSKWAYIKEYKTKVTPKYSMITFPFYDGQITEIMHWLWDRFDGNPSRDTYLIRIGKHEYHPTWGAPESRYNDPKIYFKNPKDLTFFILSCTK